MQKKASAETPNDFAEILQFFPNSLNNPQAQN